MKQSLDHNRRGGSERSTLSGISNLRQSSLNGERLGQFATGGIVRVRNCVAVSAADGSQHPGRFVFGACIAMLVHAKLHAFNGIIDKDNLSMASLADGAVRHMVRVGFHQLATSLQPAFQCGLTTW